MRRGATAARINVLVVVMALVVITAGLRLVQIQGLDPQAYAAQANSLVKRSQPLPAVRGSITDRNGQVLAQSSPAVDVTADPSVTVAHADAIAAILAKYLGGAPADYLEPLTRPNTRYAMIKRQVPAHTYDLIRAELAKAGDNAQYGGGIWTSTNSIRTYPAGTLAANVVGVLKQDDDGVFRTGAYGFEYSRNTSLAGVDGTEVYQASPAGTKIPLGANEVTPAEDGTTYQLTIDSELQWTAEQAVRKVVDSSQAKSGYAIVMNVKTGEVLAMANYPSFNPSDLKSAKADNMNNKAISAALEPGSVEKVLTFAALADSGRVTPETQVFVPSKLSSADLTITDSEAHGDLRLTASGVLAHSSNIGTVQLARQLPKADLVSYLKSFGLGQRSGIELPGEATGWAPPTNMPDYSRDQVAFGQGLSVTGIQMASAVAGILNGGIYNSPTIIRSATGADGAPVALDRPAPRRVISEQASALVNQMMESVTGPGGTGSGMALPGYRSVAKTATAERYDEKTGRYAGYTAGFIGAAPAEDPQILTYVVVDNPVKGRYGSTLAGPAYKEIMTYALPRYGVAPSTTKAPDTKLDW
ncbi:cell division protein FtsI (penicillin-binding protein 3) [Raineyella antarctica]|uniref:Cell division protein FtsI (Penicillin-binding protein 3) n=2 Tax=Raineyella antarctica TaxID=1577474 RepID=A0A1G6GG52_9ACTN|nr:cell division protein FtsI (penicillin-binding protein 3) [Raineyella antarctica]